MARLELGGYEGPIPNIALPDPKLSADMPVQSLVLADGSTFEKADWVSLGYTHYEVWCVGAAGGQGAEAGDPDVKTLYTTEKVPMPDWMWEGEIRYKIAEFAFEGRTIFPKYVFNTVPGRTGEVITIYQTPREAAIDWLGGLNVAREVTVFHHQNAYVVPYSGAPVIGGAGGGGGLQVMSGVLNDLPDSVPIAVGQAGIDAIAAQIGSPDLYDPFFRDSTLSLSDFSSASFYEDRQLALDTHYFTNTWPPLGDPTRPLFPPGQPGNDGGASAFGEICMASGGKGGGPAIVWVGTNRFFAAHGGEGGVGGRLEAGGGAAGSTDSSKNGKDGIWDGTIGQGGGGGRGGMSEVKAEVWEMPMAVYRG